MNTYGPRMRVKDGRAIPAFISQALQGEPLTVFGAGNQTRSFCYVRDLVEGLYRLLTSDFNEPVNLGSPSAMTIRELAETVPRLAGAPVGIELKPLPVDDPKVRQPDITRARTILNWQPEVTLEDGLARTLEYFRKKLGLA